ncbi:MAG: AAA family ATPase [Thermosipho sp. (in: Bacteria)]|nr:AAA family ATPase [Thermosipho sp. (in: thermotogales)]
MKQEGAPINVVLASVDSDFMMDITQDLQAHPQIKVIGFASNGEAAIERATKMAADVVLTEYSLTDITGTEIAKRLAEDSPGTQVFVITDNITGQLVQSCKAVGIKEVFPKTGFSPKEAANRIAAEVDNARREWSEIVKKHGAVEKGTGPMGVQKTKTEYIARPITQTIVMTHNTKGGVGKSTIAVNLATAIKISPYFSGQRVALVDFDCGGANVGTLCNISDNDCYNRNLATWEYVREEELTPGDVDDMMIDGPNGIKILPAPLNQKVAEDINQDTSAELCNKILRVLRKYFGIIVIDGAPNLSPTTDAAMEHSTHILLIANPEGQSVKQLARTVNLLRPTPDYPDKPDMTYILRKMRIVLNHAQGESKWDLKPDEIATTVGIPIFAEIPHDEVVKKALHSEGNKQAVELEPDGPFAVAIKRLANDICGAYPNGIGNTGTNGKKGLFKKLLRKG